MFNKYLFLASSTIFSEIKQFVVCNMHYPYFHLGHNDHCNATQRYSNDPLQDNQSNCTPGRSPTCDMAIHQWSQKIFGVFCLTEFQSWSNSNWVSPQQEWKICPILINGVPEKNSNSVRRKPSLTKELSIMSVKK